MTRILIAAAALLLLPSVAGAQARLAAAAAPPLVQPPPPEPVRTPVSERPVPEQVVTVPPNEPPRDLFQATPTTYAPRFDRLLTREELGLTFPVVPTVWPVWAPPSVPYLVQRAGEVHPVPVWPPQPKIVVVVPPRPDASATPVGAPPAVSVPPAPRKTIYVIPNCYAGDKPPRRDQLRRGCRLADMRTISPAL